MCISVLRGVPAGHEDNGRLCKGSHGQRFHGYPRTPFSLCPRSLLSGDCRDSRGRVFWGNSHPIIPSAGIRKHPLFELYPKCTSFNVAFASGSGSLISRFSAIILMASLFEKDFVTDITSRRDVLDVTMVNGHRPSVLVIYQIQSYTFSVTYTIETGRSFEVRVGAILQLDTVITKRYHLGVR